MAKLAKICSGGQTGVDRAALDVALERDFPAGGWCPRGRLAEDGPLPERYPLMETPLDDYAQRTEWNVRDADGTLILTYGAPTGGTAYTIAMARKWGKPCHVAEFDDGDALETVLAWLDTQAIRALNVAGPRESTFPGAYARARTFLEALFGKQGV